MQDTIGWIEWEEKYAPLTKNEDVQYFETYGEHIEEAKRRAEAFAAKSGAEPYQHVWTLMDGDDGEVFLSNGWRYVNRINYVVTEKPWGEIGSDKDIYLEVLDD